MQTRQTEVTLKSGKKINRLQALLTCKDCGQDYWVTHKKIDEYLAAGTCSNHGCNGKLIVEKM